MGNRSSMSSSQVLSTRSESDNDDASSSASPPVFKRLRRGSDTRALSPPLFATLEETTLVPDTPCSVEVVAETPDLTGQWESDVWDGMDTSQALEIWESFFTKNKQE